jgi:hypothetical protein
MPTDLGKSFVCALLASTATLGSIMVATAAFGIKEATSSNVCLLPKLGFKGPKMA